MNVQRRRSTRGRHWAIASLSGCLALGLTACKSKPADAPIVAGTNAPDGSDPAAGNMAPPYTGGDTGGYNAAAGGNAASGNGGKTRVLGQTQSYAGQSNGEAYGGQYDVAQPGSAPIVRQAPAGSPGYYGSNGQGYSDAEEAGEQALAETDQAPPPLPEYDQPPAPEQNDLWTPGYWNYAQNGYYWVPGAWCAPPFYGALWTPSWWGFYGGHYLFHRGYWGPHVGYYGGINYGFGYVGSGYYGGYWRGHDFNYNRSVTNVNANVIHNVYSRQVVYNGREYGPHPDNRVSYNGGRGGITYQPRPAELAAAREPHYAPVAAQRDLRLAAASNRGQFFGANGGRPAQAFAGRPVGAIGNVAAAPREQPFNHPGAPAAGGTAFGGRPGVESGRPGAQGGFNAAGRPGQTPGFQPGRQPGATPGATQGQLQGRPNQAGPASGQERLNQIPGRQSGAYQGRVGPTNTPAPAAQPGGARPGNPTFNHQLPPNNRPGGNDQPRPNGQPTQPGSPQARPGTPQGGAGRPGFGGARPAPAQPTVQPRVDAQRPAPQFQSRPAPAPAARPAPAPAPAARPAPPPAARPAPAPRPAPAAAPAPRAAAGGEHEGHH